MMKCECAYLREVNHPPPTRPGEHAPDPGPGAAPMPIAEGVGAGAGLLRGGPMTITLFRAQDLPSRNSPEASSLRPDPPMPLTETKTGQLGGSLDLGILIRARGTIATAMTQEGGAQTEAAITTTLSPERNKP